MAQQRPKSKVRHTGVNGVVGATALRDQSTEIIEDLIGINLKNLGDASPEDLAQIGDLHRASQRLTKMLPTLEKYLSELLEGRLAYEGFLTRVQKSGYNTQKRIDKLVLDLYLAQAGYNSHLTMMQQQQSAGISKLNANNRAEQEYIAFDLATYLQQLAISQAKRQQRRKQELEFSNGVTEEMEDWNLFLRMWDQGNLHALRYGSDAPNPYYERVGYTPRGTTAMVQYSSPFQRTQSPFDRAGGYAARQAGRGAKAAGRAAGRAAKKGASGLGKRIGRFLGFGGNS